MATKSAVYVIDPPMPIAKKARVLWYPSDIADAEEAFASEVLNPHQTRHAVVTELVRRNLGDYLASDEERYRRRIIRRMKIIECERS